VKAAQIIFAGERYAPRPSGSAGLPRCLWETCGFLLCTAKRPQVPAKIRRGPALQRMISRRQWLFFRQQRSADALWVFQCEL